MKRIFRQVERFNESVAVRGTLAFGTMFTCYAFMLYGLLPKFRAVLIATGFTQDQALYWSNWVQLWSLPLIMVGQNVGARKTERLITKIYDLVKQELAELKEKRANPCAGCAYLIKPRKP